MTADTLKSNPAATLSTASNPPATPVAGPIIPQTVTLDQLAGEVKMTTRDARMLLRLAAKQTKQYPNLGKDHVARQPWQWTQGSRALAEARKALSDPNSD